MAIGLGVGLSGKNDSDSGSDPIEDSEPWKNFRLPDNILPESYRITLKPDVKEDISYGFEDITVDVVKSTKFVIIHALEDLTGVTRFEVSQEGTNFKKTREFYWNEEKQQYYVVELERALQVGKAELHIEWAGPLVRSGSKI